VTSKVIRRVATRSTGLGIAGDSGAAMLEFVSLVVLLVIPLTYLVLTVFEVQRATFGVGSAARESARVFVLAPGSVPADEQARVAAQLVLADHGVDPDTTVVSITCSADPCLTPREVVTVTVSTRVPLPLVPGFLSSLVPVEVPVQATQRQVVDAYVALRP
jgi:hypothetical protein